MALNNYSNLKASIISWSHRDDVTTLIDDFILIAEEAMFAHPDFPLQLRQMEARATASASTSSRFLALPDRFINMRRLKINAAGGDCDVVFLTPEQMPLSGTSGQPRFFSVTSQIEFDRQPDSAYTVEMQYFAAPLPLDATNSTNDVLTNHPTVYLYGALWALSGWAGDMEKEAMYLNKFTMAIRGANKEFKQGRYGPAPKIRIEGPTP